MKQSSWSGRGKGKIDRRRVQEKENRYGDRDEQFANCGFLTYLAKEGEKLEVPGRGSMPMKETARKRPLCVHTDIQKSKNRKGNQGNPRAGQDHTQMGQNSQSFQGSSKGCFPGSLVVPILARWLATDKQSGTGGDPYEGGREHRWKQSVTNEQGSARD